MLNTQNPTDNSGAELKRRAFLKVLGTACASTTVTGCGNEQVERLMRKRGVSHVRMKPGRYAGELRKLVRTHEPKRKLDLMIVHALIEARSCERFRLLSKHLPAEVRELYAQLERSEARHFEIYLDFAAREYDAEEIAQRLDLIATREAELATTPDRDLRFHSGPVMGTFTVS